LLGDLLNAAKESEPHPMLPTALESPIELQGEPQGSPSFNALLALEELADQAKPELAS
jgi:hypothetical protein